MDLDRYLVLRGEHVELWPMGLVHLDGLCDAGLFEEIWEWMPYRIRDRGEMRRYIGEAIAALNRRTQYPFVIVELATGNTVGSTRFMNIEPADRKLEIGGTWVTPAKQRTSVNTEAKLLLLTCAFEALGAERVEFKTDVLNEKSQRAILRLGATREGILRSHMITGSGRIRDSVYYSILSSEWEEVKTRLRRMRDGNR